MNFLEMVESMEEGKLYQWEHGGQTLIVSYSGLIYKMDGTYKIPIMHKNLFLGKWREIPNKIL